MLFHLVLVSTNSVFSKAFWGTETVSLFQTLLQTMCLPLGESGAWWSKILPCEEARWRRVGTTRM